jgi:hypothetical protein
MRDGTALSKSNGQDLDRALIAGFGKRRLNSHLFRFLMACSDYETTPLAGDAI